MKAKQRTKKMSRDAAGVASAARKPGEASQVRWCEGSGKLYVGLYVVAKAVSGRIECIAEAVRVASLQSDVGVLSAALEGLDNWRSLAQL